MDSHNDTYVACWGIFDSSGGLYRIQDQTMIDVSAQFGIDSKKLLSVVFDKQNDVLYVGSKDKGFYKVQLDKSILSHTFLNQKVIRFRDNLILHNHGLDFTFNNGNRKTITRENFKRFQNNNSGKNFRKTSDFERGSYELNYKLNSSKIDFYDLQKYNELYYINSNLGILAVNKSADIVKYIPIHTYKFGFTSDNLFYESTLMDQLNFTVMLISCI